MDEDRKGDEFPITRWVTVEFTRDQEPRVSPLYRAELFDRLATTGRAQIDERDVGTVWVHIPRNIPDMYMAIGLNAKVMEDKRPDADNVGMQYKSIYVSQDATKEDLDAIENALYELEEKFPHLQFDFDVGWDNIKDEDGDEDPE